MSPQTKTQWSSVSGVTDVGGERGLVQRPTTVVKTSREGLCVVGLVS